jgi:hypothetical protein
LDDNPEQSKLWTELEKIIAFGGSFDNFYDSEQEFFVAPYVFGDFPNELDGFECFAIIDKNVNVYAENDIKSRVIDHLNYNIIKFNNIRLDWYDAFWRKSDDDLVKIKTLSGEMGYIAKKYIRSPIDYRLFIEYKDNIGWKLTVLVAGD